MLFFKIKYDPASQAVQGKTIHSAKQHYKVFGKMTKGISRLASIIFCHSSE